MASTILILGTGLLVLIVVVVFSWHRCPEVQSIDEWEAKKHEVDVQVLKALMDLDEEHRLRSCLTHKQFQQYQRRRTRLAIRILQLIEENVGMLMSLAQRAKVQRDPALTEKADEMIAVGFQLRGKLLVAKLCLSAKWLFPSHSVPLPSFELKYRELLDCLIQAPRYRQQALT
jgi:hypothetical protein